MEKGSDLAQNSLVGRIGPMPGPQKTPRTTLSIQVKDFPGNKAGKDPDEDLKAIPSPTADSTAGQ